MGLLAYVRSALNPTELTASGPGFLAVGRDGSLWVRPAGSVTTSAPAPVARAALIASAALPAAGAYSTLGTAANIPSGASFAQLWLTYTRSSGQAGAAASKVFLSNGTEVAQVSAPDGSYNPIAGPVPPSDTAIVYAIGPIDLRGGSITLNISSAEVGATASPGTLAVGVTFS